MSQSVDRLLTDLAARGRAEQVPPVDVADDVIRALSRPASQVEPWRLPFEWIAGLSALASVASIMVAVLRWDVWMDPLLWDMMGLTGGLI